MEPCWPEIGKTEVMRAGEGESSGQGHAEGAGSWMRRGPRDEPWEGGGQIPWHLDKTILGSTVQQPRVSRDTQLSLEGVCARAQWPCYPAREVSESWNQCPSPSE